jgi:hypothetical protein
MGDGILALYPTAEQVVEILDLDDGRRRRFRIPDGMGLDHVLHVRADRIWIVVNEPDAVQSLLSFDPRDLPYEP